MIINRDDRIVSESYDQMYASTNPPSTRKRSLIVHPVGAYKNMKGSDGSLSNMGICLTELPYMVYIPLRLEKCLIVLDFSKNHFVFYDCVRNLDGLKAQKYFVRFLAMLERSDLLRDSWRIVINRGTTLKYTEQIFEDYDADIRILAIISFIMKNIPICFTIEHLLYFRRNLTIALYENSSIL